MRKNISLKASTSKAKVQDIEDDLSNESSKYEEMGLFVRRYSKHIRKNNLKHLDQNMIKLRKSNPPNKWDDKKKEEKNVTCFECGKLRHKFKSK